MNTDFMVTVAVALVSGTGGWGLLQFILNRRGRKAEAGRQEAEAETAREALAKAQADRANLLAEAQATAQRTALDSANERYGQLKSDWEECRAGLKEAREAQREGRKVMAALISAIDALVAQLKPGQGDEIIITVTRAEMATITTALLDARAHLMSYD